MEGVARGALRLDPISTSVVFEGDMQGLVDVADPVAQELEGLKLLLVGRIGRCQDGEVVLDRGYDALFSQRAFVLADLRHIARNVDEVLGRALPGRPIGPIAGGAKRAELLILLDELDHPLAGRVIQLEKRNLADHLVG
jgi:hypothetical protein